METLLPIENITRDAWIEINLNNLTHNVTQLKNIAGNKKLLGVVKADAYGHGAVEISKTLLLSGFDMLGVALIDEAMALRHANINSNILILGAIPLRTFELAVQNDLSLTIFSDEHLETCRQVFNTLGIKPKVHIKINTGMNRIGILPKDTVEFIKRVQSADFVDLKGIFTHFANAKDNSDTQKQIDKWNNVISQIDSKNLLLHVQNTLGTMYYDVVNSNMCRIGIGLYGHYPETFSEDEKSRFNLKPLITLKSKIIHINEVNEGDGVGYSFIFKANSKRRIATAPIGYADGIPRCLSNKIFATLNGQKIPQVGSITMDQMMFDVTDVDVKVGDTITLLENDNISDWAELAHTINYELLCQLGSRLDKIYTLK